MVYGRYNELVHAGFVMVYKPKNILWGPHPVEVFCHFRGISQTCLSRVSMEEISTSFHPWKPTLGELLFLTTWIMQGGAPQWC